VLPVVLLLFAVSSSPPSDNPARLYKIAWTDRLPWSRVVNLADIQGDSLAARLQTAQQQLRKQGGGVVYFPAGDYTFEDDIFLEDGVILRGATPTGVTDARQEGYAPPTRFFFPRYRPTFTGAGTPNHTAFKGIRLRDPGTASRCGVVHLDLHRGHIHLGDDGSSEHRAGSQRLVLGCVLRNAAVADPAVPDRRIEQHAWQRFTHRHHAAITVKGADLLIAGNRLPKSGEENFTMKDYIVRAGKTKVSLPEVVFDYDNRPGLYINDYGLGGSGASLPDGTPQSHPWGFRKGIVIRDNYLYHTGRCAIAFAGDGVICSGNVIRFAREIYRPTATGRDRTTGASTNDNRAIQMRGWRWVVENNDYEVYRNLAADRKYYINDGEGLMHEDHVNSTIRDSVLRNNRGNTYLSLYKTGGIDGLLIEGNDIRDGIFVVADRNKSRHLCRKVRIINNTTHGGAITIAGMPAEDNEVRGNRSVGKPARLDNRAAARLQDNENFTLSAK